MKRIPQFLKELVMMFVFIIAAYLLFLVLDSVWGSDVARKIGWLAYMVMSLVYLGVCRRKLISQKKMVRDLRDLAEKAKSSSEEDTHEQPSLEEVRERIRRRKIEAGERG